MSVRLEQSTVLVTGATGGIGRRSRTRCTGAKRPSC